ncbi:MAG: hypothetical protein K6E10_04440 [Eubacterium sp.]|nr:hypothetical protein [Eubacterium sp.]
MFRIWGKVIKDNHMIKDTVISLNDKKLSRTKKVYKSLEMICQEFDLPIPIWHDVNKKEFIDHSMTRFQPVSFMESVEFDYLEIRVIEEDNFWE